MSVIKGTLILTESAALTIESLRPGQLVLTHRNRLRGIVEIRRSIYSGDAIELRFHEHPGVLTASPEQMLALCAPSLPPFRARVRTARYLRRNQTEAENLLWQRLRSNSLNVKFRRQHPMGDFVLDFYCPRIRLAIEVDGGVHDSADQEEYDRFRQRLIEDHEVAFLRFSNVEVLKQIWGVIDRVANKVRERLVRFDHSIAWIRAEDCTVRSVLAAGAQAYSVRSVRRVAVQDEFCALTVEKDGSALTEFCGLCCR